MLQALALAEAAVGLSEPNPRVGCVIGNEDGRILGEGHTQAVGGPHAEVMALRQARAAGAVLAGATAWVTLEPCAHQGRTPPCCEALIEAGLSRVVVAVEDPFPAVAGRGLGRLRACGIEVVMAGADLAQAARELNIGFFTRHESGRPWVRLKAACSLDGRTALPDGRSQWITGEAARADGHHWRRRAGAVLTGVGTVLADDPRLDVRLVPTTVQPLRVVVDSQLRTPPGARLLSPAVPPVLIATLDAEGGHAAALRERGAELVAGPPGPDGRVDLRRLLATLAARGVNEVHVEAGARLNGSLLEQALVDEILLYQAPLLLGPGLGVAELPLLPDLAQVPRWRLVEVQRVGEDLRLRARPLAALAPCRNN